MKEITIKDLTWSDVAFECGINNQPSYDELCCMHDLIDNVLNPINLRVGELKVNSGYRNEKVNRLVGGVRNSQHMKGQAADIRCGSKYKDNIKYLDEVENFAREHLNYDQLIRYDTFIHLSYNASRNRRQYIDKRKRGYGY